MVLTFVVLGDKRRQGGGMSLTIQYKGVTRLDVIPAASCRAALRRAPFSPFVKGRIGKRYREIERESEIDTRGKKGGGMRRKERDTSPPPTIPLAGTVICCMHASRDG